MEVDLPLTIKYAHWWLVFSKKHRVAKAEGEKFLRENKKKMEEVMMESGYSGVADFLDKNMKNFDL